MYSKPGRIERAGEVSVVGFQLRIERHVVEHAKRRQADADLVLADRRNHRVDDLDHKARAVLDRTAIGVGALVRIRADELLEQITIGAVQLDAVEPGGNRVLRRVHILSQACS